MRFTKVGLTGGIAAGKSSVADRWRQNGAAIVDTDRLAHETLTPNTPTWREVVAAFGEGILNADRTIDRSRLGEIVFGDEARRQVLNRIVHPAVRRKWAERLEAIERDDPAGVAVVVIPLLYEVGAESEFDCVAVVACSETTQLARLGAKGFTETQARARIGAQWPVQQKLDRADFVIWNDGTPDVLQRQADMTWATIKENPHAPQT